MSDGQLVPADLSQLPETKQGVPTVQDVVSSSEFFPFIVLVQGQSTFATDPNFDLKSGTFIIPAGGKDPEQVIKLGSSFEAVILAWRWKAINFNVEPVQVALDFDSEEFQAIKKMSDSKEQGYNYGPEYLLWVDSEETFATFPCLSVTLRNAAKREIQKLIKHNALIKAHWIDPEKSKHAWWGIKCVQSTNPVQNFPTLDVVQEAVERFINETTAESQETEEEIPH